MRGGWSIILQDGTERHPQGAVLLHLLTKYPHLREVLPSYVSPFAVSTSELWDLGYNNFQTALGADWEDIVAPKHGTEHSDRLFHFAPSRVYIQPIPDPDYRLFPTILQARPEPLRRGQLLQWVSDT